MKHALTTLINKQSFAGVNAKIVVTQLNPTVAVCSAYCVQTKRTSWFYNRNLCYCSDLNAKTNRRSLVLLVFILGDVKRNYKTDNE